MDAKEVGIRVFSANIAEYGASGTPVAVIQGGQIVGYFIPTPQPDGADVAAQEQAGEGKKHLPTLLKKRGADVRAGMLLLDHLERRVKILRRYLDLDNRSRRAVFFAVTTVPLTPRNPGRLLLCMASNAPPASAPRGTRQSNFPSQPVAL